jgi:hypothetical protein
MSLSCFWSVITSHDTRERRPDASRPAGEGSGLQATGQVPVLDLSRSTIAGEVVPLERQMSRSVGVAAVLIYVGRKFLLELWIVLNHLDDLVVLLRIQTLVADRAQFV